MSKRVPIADLAELAVSNKDRLYDLMHDFDICPRHPDCWFLLAAALAAKGGRLRDKWQFDYSDRATGRWKATTGRVLKWTDKRKRALVNAIDEIIARTGTTPNSAAHNLKRIDREKVWASSTAESLAARYSAFKAEEKNFST